MVLLMILHRFVLRDVITGSRAGTALADERYEPLHWALKGTRPVWLLVSVFGLFVISAARCSG